MILFNSIAPSWGPLLVLQPTWGIGRESKKKNSEEIAIKMFVTKYSFFKSAKMKYSDTSIKNTVLRLNRQYKANTAEVAEYRYS